MERVGTLINKLKEQFDLQADAANLSITAQLILAELQFNKNVESIHGKVSVIMPSIMMSNVEVPELEAENTASVGWLFDKPIEIPTLTLQDFSEKKNGNENIELLSLNETINNNNELALNDHLKEERIEVVTKLAETPIRDLRKAISTNDRYLFVNTLFRGDENMYERSIKTINSFSIYPEAQYWIQRELKVKLGWEDGNDSVKHFDQLIKRRFS